jgi:hypothetical protein
MMSLLPDKVSIKEQLKNDECVTLAEAGFDQ